MVKKLGLDVKEVVAENIDNIVDQMTECLDTHPGVFREIVKTVVVTNPGDILPHILQVAGSALANPDLLAVTATDYQVYLTPAGEVYDKSVVENLKNDGANNKNIKRENKEAKKVLSCRI